MNDETQGGLIILAVIVVIGTLTFGSAGISFHLQYENIDALQEKYNCDQLHVFYEQNDDRTNHRYETELEYAIYYKCMEESFPNGYPSDAELIKHFGTFDCEQLKTHVEKYYYSYDIATEIHNLQCDETIGLLFEQEVQQLYESSETWIKSDEFGYGAQYED